MLTLYASVFLCFFSACQVTPKEEVIIKQGPEEMEIQSMDSNFCLNDYLASIPPQWEEEIILSNGKVTIDIDAKVDYPQISKIPIVEVLPASFEPELIHKIVSFFGGDGAYLSLPPQDAEGYALPTAKDYELWISEITKTIQKVTADYAGTGSEEVMLYLAELEEERKVLTEKLAACSGDDAAIVTDYETLVDTFQFEADLCDRAGNRAAKVQIGLRGKPGNDRRECFIFASAIDISGHSSVINSLDDAVKFSDAFLQQLEIYESYELVSIIGDQDAVELCYGARYKGLSYSPLVNRNIVFENQYSPAWVDERITIGFEFGHSSPSFFHWWGHGIYGEAVTDNAQLCDFSVIQNACRTQLAASYSWRTEDIKATNVTVDRISLGYMRVKMQNNANRYMLIPVWTFQGEITNTLSLENGFDQRAMSEPLPDKTVLVLSAIDGRTIYSGTTGGEFEK